ncbi:MAG: PcfB family protein [Angelakisella sp.]
MPEIQEDVSELAARWLVKVPKLSAKLVVAALDALLRHQKNKEPLGELSMKKLMANSSQPLEQASLVGMEKDMKLFQKLARQYGVGFSVFKRNEEYTLFFRAGRAEQMNACLAAYAKAKLTRQPESIGEKVERAEKQSVEHQQEKNMEAGKDAPKKQPSRERTR